MAPYLPVNKKDISVDRSRPGRIGWEDSYTMRHMLEKLSAAGLEEAEIANLLGVRLGSLKQQLMNVPELEEALVKGKSSATQAMVAQVYKAAFGGQVYQEIIEKIDTKGQKHTTIITKESPPNPMLMIFWLTNRDGDNWRHIRQIMKESRTAQTSHGNIAEADKIARLSRDILECYPSGSASEHFVPEETPRAPQCELRGAGDVPGDVQAETADNVQDDAMDVSA